VRLAVPCHGQCGYVEGEAPADMQKKAQGLEAHRVATSGEPALGTKASEPIKPVLLVKGFYRHVS